MVFRAGSRPPRDDARLAPLEALIVGGVIIASVAFVVVSFEAPGVSPATSRALEQQGQDALALLSEAPATDGFHGNMLEQLLSTAARDGDCQPFRERMSRLFAPGVVVNVYVETAGSRPVPLCEADVLRGQVVTVSTLVSPSWTTLYLTPTVQNVSGVMALDGLGGPLASAAHAFEVQGLLVRDGFLDTKTNVSLTFENAWAAALETRENGLRTTGPLFPEHVHAQPGNPLSSAHAPGYAVPYETTGSWGSYVASVATVSLDAPREFSISHNLDLGASDGVLYAVHPEFTAAEALVVALQNLDEDYQLRASLDPGIVLGGSGEAGVGAAGLQSPVPLPGEPITLEFNFTPILEIDVPLEMEECRIGVYNPAGTREAVYDVVGPAGRVDHGVSASIWGTYVGHVQCRIMEFNPLTGNPTNVSHVVNGLTYYTLHPPGWEALSYRVSPVYRLTLAIGLEDWEPRRATDGSESGDPFALPGAVMSGPREGWVDVGDMHLIRIT